ncbi:hypothetical protein THAOC_22779, partial [Thalassiosira oceanica]
MPHSVHSNLNLTQRDIATAHSDWALITRAKTDIYLSNYNPVSPSICQYQYTPQEQATDRTARTRHQPGSDNRTRTRDTEGQRGKEDERPKTHNGPLSHLEAPTPPVGEGDRRQAGQVLRALLLLLQLLARPAAARVRAPLPLKLDVRVQAPHGQEADGAPRQGLLALRTAGEDGLLPRQPRVRDALLPHEAGQGEGGVAVVAPRPEVGGMPAPSAAAEAADDGGDDEGLDDGPCLPALACPPRNLGGTEPGRPGPLPPCCRSAAAAPLIRLSPSCLATSNAALDRTRDEEGGRLDVRRPVDVGLDEADAPPVEARDDQALEVARTGAPSSRAQTAARGRGGSETRTPPGPRGGG